MFSKLQRLSGKLSRVFGDVAAMPGRLRSIEEHSQQLTRMASNVELDRILRDIARVDTRRLELWGLKRFSQNDEDGIIAEIFRRIGTTNRTFVEFGTADGKENNTVSLLLQGWSGLWMEGSREKQASQVRTFAEFVRSGGLVSKQVFLTKENINALISDAGYSGVIDLLSIDVDGNDYHLWQAISVIQPRLVVIEYNAYIAPPHRWIMPYSENYVWDERSTYFGASLASLAELASMKGYVLVGCNAIGLNAFFVKREFVGDAFANPGDVVALYHPRRWWLDRVFQNARIDISLPYSES